MKAPPRTNLLQKLYLYIHRTVYNSRQKKQERFPGKYIISVGNLSAGGTGKTPLTILLAKHLMRLKPLAVLRGYGGAAERPLLVSDGKKLLGGFEDAGDEAILMAKVRGLRVAVARKRSEAIRLFSDPSKCVILDDAFQNPSVYRNHDIVLIDSTIPPEKVKVFPSGHFRDNLQALFRADTVLLTRTDQISREKLAEWKEAVLNYAVPSAVFESSHAIQGVLPRLRPGRIGAFSGIGNPSSFFNSLEKMGYRIEKSRAWPDHHAYTAADLDELESWDLPLITTEKDRVRISDRLIAERKLKLHVLKIEIHIKNEKAFIKRVLTDKSKIQSLI